MADADTFDGRSQSCESAPDSVKLEQAEQRMRKVGLGVLALMTPSQLALALIEYPTDLVTQVLTFGTVPLLVFGYIMNAQQLSGTLHDSDRIFRMLVHPATRTIYMILAFAGVGGVIISV